MQKIFKILLAPEKARNVVYDTFLNRASGSQLRLDIFTQFLKGCWIFSGQKCRLGYTPCLKAE
ncbi:MAG TPA: hypothetical protein VH678_30480 [Xanthobacteraceae bacterium]|jgi:hypothetical protein